MKKIISIALFFCFYGNIFAQAPDTLWTKSYGGSGNDLFWSISQTNDGGFILAGGIEDMNEDPSVYKHSLVRMDNQGDTLWTKKYDNKGEPDGDKAFETPEGGFVLISSDPSIIKTNSSGTFQWSVAQSIIDTFNIKGSTLSPDNGIVVVGFDTSKTNGNYITKIAKVSSTGSLDWKKTYEYPDDLLGLDIIALESGYALCGHRAIPNSLPGGWLMLIDADGDSLWLETYSYDTDVHFNSLKETTDGGFIMCGVDESVDNSRQIILVKTSSTGVVVWSKTFGGSGNDEPFEVVQTDDGGYAVVGYGDLASNDNMDLLLIQTDSNGDINWTKQMHGSGGTAASTGIVALGNENFILSGVVTFTSDSSDWQAWVIRLGTDNSLPVFLHTFNGDVSQSNVTLKWSTDSEIENLGFSIYKTENDEVSENRKLVASYKTINALEGQGTITELTNYEYTDTQVKPGTSYSHILSDTDFSGKETIHTNRIVTVKIPNKPPIQADKFILYHVYPNPFNTEFIIPFTLTETMDVEISLFNISGRKVKSIHNKNHTQGAYKIAIDANDIGSGIYLLKMIMGKTIRTQKIVLIK
ncbi:MAG: T9SS type A sorting domain-containing protein [Candidatus Marinimicrobia bacterium]|nr:T9SS type A sorting domain-containing protein [Candidatus Neomarinimicrobiota bacterium]